MSSEPRPTVAVETIRPFRELFDALEQAGFETEHRHPQEQRSAGAVGEKLALYLLKKLTEPEVDRLVATVRGWATSWLWPRLRRSHARPRSKVRIPIYGPDDDLLTTIEVDED
jgi:hypothetical protein